MQGDIHGALDLQTADSGVCTFTGAGDDSWGGADQHSVHAKGLTQQWCSMPGLPAVLLCMSSCGINLSFKTAITLNPVCRISVLLVR